MLQTENVYGRQERKNNEKKNIYKKKLNAELAALFTRSVKCQKNTHILRQCWRCAVEWIAGKLQKSMAKQAKANADSHTHTGTYSPEHLKTKTKKKKTIFKRNFNCLQFFSFFHFIFSSFLLFFPPFACLCAFCIKPCLSNRFWGGE